MKTLLTGIGLVVALAIPVHAQAASGMEIGVRSGIDLAEKVRRDKDPAYAADNHQRLRRYVLASIKEVKTDESLVKPFNARAMAAELNKQLQAHGFHPVGPGEKPEIIITAQYARGMILDPYRDAANYAATDDRYHKRGPANLSNSTPNTNVFTHQIFVGVTSKSDNFENEKLAIEVTAMQYPPPADPKQKPVILWSTIMYTDDPANRDLNLVMPTLLASGAPYFDKHLDREREYNSYSNLPDGHVNVGAPEVVEPAKSK